MYPNFVMEAHDFFFHNSIFQFSGIVLYNINLGFGWGSKRKQPVPRSA